MFFGAFHSFPRCSLRMMPLLYCWGNHSRGYIICAFLGLQNRFFYKNLGQFSCLVPSELNSSCTKGHLHTRKMKHFAILCVTSSRPCREMNHRNLLYLQLRMYNVIFCNFAWAITPMPHNLTLCAIAYFLNLLSSFHWCHQYLRQE